MGDEVNVFAQVCNTARVASGRILGKDFPSSLILTVVGNKVASV